MTTIVQPTSADELDAVRALMRDFIAWHQVRHAEHIDLVNKYFNGAEFEEELAGLPGKYSPPKGQLLLAINDDMPAGCVALRQIDSSTCEMKRMFVREGFQGLGTGFALANAIIEEAKKLGYKRMVLDSGAKQIEAHTLYRKVGFTDISPYYSLPDDLADWLVFMGLDLTQPA